MGSKQSSPLRDVRPPSPLKRRNASNTPVSNSQNRHLSPVRTIRNFASSDPNSTTARATIPPKATKEKTLGILVDHINCHRWKSVVSHSKSHPKDLFPTTLVFCGVKRKMTVLHLACAYDPPRNVIEEMLSIYENAVRMPMFNCAAKDAPLTAKNPKGNPLTLLRNMQTSQSTIHSSDSTLLYNNTTSSRHSNNVLTQSDNWLPLHIAIFYDASPNVIQFLLKYYSVAAACKNGMGMLPLHIICAGLVTTKRQNLADVVLLLLKAFPGGVNVPCSTSAGWTAEQYVRNGSLVQCGEGEKILKLLRMDRKHLKSLAEKNTTMDHFPASEGQYAPLGESGEKVHTFSATGTVLTKKSHWPLVERAVTQKETGTEHFKATKLYKHIVANDWKAALIRLRKKPMEATIWTMFTASESIRAEVADGQADELGYWCHRLPLHRACASKPPVDIISALCAAYPESVKTREKYGMLPLHVSCQNGASVAVIKALLMAYPQAAKKKDVFGLLPLHVACATGSSVDTVTTLLKAYPEAAAVKCIKGRQPIHFVEAGFHPTKAVVLKLLRRPPQYWAAKCVKDTKQVISPLYFYVIRSEWVLAEERIKSNPEEACIWVLDDEMPSLPLHISCRRHAPVNVVNLLLMAHPQGAREKGTTQDITPLHIACQYGADEEVVLVLLEVYPIAVRDTDEFGLLPLHVAVTKGMKLSVVNALLKAYPEGATAKDKKGFTPLHYAEQSLHRNKTEVIWALKGEETLKPEPTSMIKATPIDPLLLEPVKPQQKQSFQTEFEPVPAREPECLDSFSIILQTHDDHAIPSLAVKAFPEPEQLFVDVVACSLIDLIDDENWTAIPRHMKQHPLEASKPVDTSERAFCSDDSCFPLHIACQAKPPRTVVKMLIEAFPLAARIRTEHDEYPLHIACKYGASLGTINVLIEAYEPATCAANSKGRTPLHLACVAGTTASILETLLKAAPGTASMKDNRECSCLDYLQVSFHRNKALLINILQRHMSFDHVASTTLYELVRQKKWYEVTTRAKDHHAEAGVWKKYSGCDVGRLPLHLACSLSPPRKVVAVLYNVNPESISLPEKDGRLPLHLACQSGASLEIIQLLINAYPEAVSKKDKFGNLPIHLACSARDNLNVIKVLLLAAPSSFHFKDKKVLSTYDQFPNQESNVAHMSESPSVRTFLATAQSVPARLGVDEVSTTPPCPMDKNFLSVTDKFSNTHPNSRRDVFRNCGMSKSAQVLNTIEHNFSFARESRQQPL